MQKGHELWFISFLRFSVVFLTGPDDKKKILECLSLHPAGYIMKPVEQEKLLTKIHAILSESS